MSSGEPESSTPRRRTPDELVEAYAAMLEDHLDSVGYPRPLRPFEPVSIDASSARVRTLDSDELAELALDLSNAAYAVGDECGRQRAKAEHCQAKIALLVGDSLDHSIYGAADKWMAAAFSDPDARRYWRLKQNALAVVARLEGQSSRLAELAKVVNNILYGRR